MQTRLSSRQPRGVEAKGRLLLLIEDDEYIGEALTHVLVQHGYRVGHCRDAIEALAHLREGERPALIVLDLMMPHMDGWEFRLIQRAEPAWSDIPVVALSADRSAKAATIDAAAFLRKPVDHRVLLATLESVLAPDAAQCAPSKAESAEPVSAPRMLDDVAMPLLYVLENLASARRHNNWLATELSGISAARSVAVAKLLERAQRSAHGMAEALFASSPFACAPQAGTVDVVAVLDRSLALVQPELPPGTEVRRSYATLPMVVGNAVKLGQVFVSLLRNAAEALSGRRAPLLSVDVWDSHDEQVVVTLTDNGCGMPAEHMAHVFDPFFSTHADGTARGLGLTVARRLVAELGGTLELESRDGEGTTFLLSLSRGARREPGTDPQHKPRLLLIEQSERAFERLVTALSSAFEVEGSASSRDALEHLLEGAAYDLVMCALDCAPLSGIQLYEQLTRKRPQQAARLVFLRPPGSRQHARRLLDALGIWHLNKALAGPALRSEALGLVRLWESLRLSPPE